MYGVIIALMPALLVSFYFFGLGSVVVTATSVAACVFFEWTISKYILKQERNTIKDGSAILGNIFGGGDAGMVKQDTDVQIGEPKE
jgi:electron transport complex protein RnfD